MNYIKKYQQGKPITKPDLQDSDDQPTQLLSMDAHRSTIPVAKRSSIPQIKPNMIAPGKELLRNWMTNQPVTPAEMSHPTTGTPLFTGKVPAQGTVSKYVEPSMREKVMGGMNSFDRDGKGEVQKIITAPVNSAMRLLRPDKYFNGVQNDSDVGSALGSMAMDVANVAPIAKGVGKLIGMVDQSPMLHRLADNAIAHKGVTQGNKWLNEWNSHPINTYRVAVNNQQIEESGWARSFLGRAPVQRGSVNVQIPSKADKFNMLASSGPDYDFNKPIGSIDGVYYTRTPMTPPELAGKAFIKNGVPDPKSIAIHEGTHQYTNGPYGLSLQTEKLLREPFGGRIGVAQTMEENNHPGAMFPPQQIEYLTQPTEVHARVNQLRDKFGIKPGESVGIDKTMDMLEQVKNGSTGVDPLFGGLVTDKIGWHNMFNKMFTPAAVAVGGAGTYHSMFNPTDEK